MPFTFKLWSVISRGETRHDLHAQSVRSVGAYVALRSRFSAASTTSGRRLPSPRRRYLPRAPRGAVACSGHQIGVLGIRRPPSMPPYHTAERQAHARPTFVSGLPRASHAVEAPGRATDRRQDSLDAVT